MTKTVTRLFDDYADAKTAVRELEELGIPHDDISIMSSNADGRHGNGDRDHDSDHGVDDYGDVSRGVTTGAALGGVGGLLAGLGLLAIPGLGPIVAAGWLASTAVGAGIGAAGGAATGGVVGALKEAGHSDDEAHVYSESVRRGGTIVSARVDDDRVEAAESTLHRHRAVDAATRGEDYRRDGWNGFDASAPSYTRDQMDADRQRYGANTPLV